MRSYHGKNRRAVATSKDGGLTWSDVTLDEALIEPVCQASLIALPAKKGEKPALLFSNPASTKREKMTVRLSDDEGKTWPAATRAARGAGGVLVPGVRPKGEVLCLYERGEKSAVRDDHAGAVRSGLGEGWEVTPRRCAFLSRWLFVVRSFREGDVDDQTRFFLWLLLASGYFALLGGVFGAVVGYVTWRTAPRGPASGCPWRGRSRGWARGGCLSWPKACSSALSMAGCLVWGSASSWGRRRGGMASIGGGMGPLMLGGAVLVGGAVVLGTLAHVIGGGGRLAVLGLFVGGVIGAAGGFWLAHSRTACWPAACSVRARRTGGAGAA